MIQNIPNFYNGVIPHLFERTITAQKFPSFKDKLKEKMCTYIQIICK